MMKVDNISNEFNRRLPIYERLKEEALFIVEDALQKTEIKLHSTVARVKKEDSFLTKIKLKEPEDPFNDIQDIVGIRIICLFLADIAKIGKIIRDNFTVMSEDNKIEGTDASSFGYMSVHFIVTLKSEYCGPRYDNVLNIPFEIQVRTIAMDAWANVSHYLDYKSELDVPSDLKRDFFALSGLFYVADKHFEMFSAAREKSQANTDKIFLKAKPEQITEQEINMDTLSSYLVKRFPSRERSSKSSISEVILELSECGYKTIGDVDALIDKTLDAAIGYEKEHPPSGGKYTPVGLLRACAGIMDDKFVEIQYSNHDRRSGKAVDYSSISNRQVKNQKFRHLIKS